MRVLAYTLYRGGSPQREELLKSTIKEGVEKAGYPVTWEVVDNATINYGQHLPFNAQLKRAHQEGYEHLLRVDDDVSFLTQRWLAKMVEAAAILGPRFIISPTIKGLIHPPEMSQVVDVKGVPCRFLTQAIGGACRLHHVRTLVEGGYVSDVRWPMGGGDATGLMKWCVEQGSKGEPMYGVWLDRVRVHHGTAKQCEDDAEYHELHDTLQHVPFIPAWPLDYPVEEDAPLLVGGAHDVMPEGYVDAQRQFNLRHRDGQFEHTNEATWVKPVLDDINTFSPNSILDVGCRGGASLEEIKKWLPHARVAGVDVVPEFIEAAKAKGLDAQVADMHALPFADGEFEWILCNGTFEHAYNATQAAKEFGRVASKGIYVTCDLRTVPLGSDYAYSNDPAAWRAIMAHTGMEVVEERIMSVGTASGVEFVLVRR